MVDYFSGLGIVKYHIYQDGQIEKHIPENILPGFERKYKFVFHNNEHEICICEWHTINKEFTIYIGINHYKILLRAHKNFKNVCH